MNSLGAILWHPFKAVMAAGLLAFVLPFVVMADGDGDDGDRRAGKLPDEPEQRERMLRNARYFVTRTPKRQRQLRQLDKGLRDLPARESMRLQRALERYAAWLRELPEAERESILAIPSQSERLEKIRALRELHWIQKQPLLVREALDKLDAGKKAAKITELRKEERKKRDEWRAAIRDWDRLMQRRLPSFAELRPQVESYVRETLRPMLTHEESEMLDRALRNNGPGFPRLLLTLADRHPVRLPGPSVGPSRFEELPEEYRRHLPQLRDNPPPEVQRATGKWPDYAQSVVMFARKNKIKQPLRPLGPTRPLEFSPMIQQFLESELRPRLDKTEEQQLRDAAGRWPQYPQLIKSLAQKYGLQVPGLSLPGPKEFWDSMRMRPSMGE